MRVSPWFFSSMSVVRWFDRLLNLVSKCCKYWSITPFELSLFECCLNSSLTEAPNCMTLEIGHGSTILWVQVAVNTLLTLCLASPGSTLKEMVLATLIIFNGNLCLKKTIDSRVPVDLETLYNHMRSEANNIPNVSLYSPSSCLSVLSLGSSSVLSSWLDKDGDFSLLSSPSRKKKSRTCQCYDRSNTPKLLTEDALEDRDACAFFKGKTAVAAPFLMTLLTDLVMDFTVFTTFFADDIVLEAMDCVDSKDQDEQRDDEDRKNIEFWQLIVRTAMHTFRNWVRFIYQRLTRDSGQAATARFTLCMTLNVRMYLALSTILIRIVFFL